MSDDTDMKAVAIEIPGFTLSEGDISVFDDLSLITIGKANEILGSRFGRYVQLLSLRAPDVVLANERALIATALALVKFVKKRDG